VKEGWDIIKEFGFGPLPKNIVCPKDGDEMVLVSEGQFTMTNCIDQKLLEHGGKEYKCQISVFLCTFIQRL